MAIPTTDKTDNFDQWRINTNEVANNQGDLTTLDPSLPQTSLVDAINDFVTDAENDNRRLLARAIAMS